MKKITIGSLFVLFSIGSLPAAVTLVGVNTLTTPTTWLTDGYISEGGANYQNSVVGNFTYYNAGTQSVTSMSVEWGTAGTIDTSMGQAKGGSINWVGTPAVGDSLVFQGIAPVDGYYAIVNFPDSIVASKIEPNKIFLTAGQIGTWVDSDPTKNERYSFIQVDNVTNLNNGGNVGAWGASIVPEPSSAVLFGLGGLALVFLRRK